MVGGCREAAGRLYLGLRDIVVHLGRKNAQILISGPC
jgi:hypothetical protein